MKNKRLYYFFLLPTFLLFSLSDWSFSQTSVTNEGVIKISNEIFVINSTGCNIAVIIGQEGLLIIDTGDNRFAMKTDSLISTISDLPIKYILNTHLHYDHLGGNRKLSENGAVIVAHENTRKGMLTEWNMPEIAGIKYPVIPPYPEEYLPKICFRDSLSIYFNNDIIKCFCLPNGHTDGDVIYYFQKPNLIHTGDLFLSNGFPIINPLPGSINAYIKAVDEIINICDENTVIIPGHGPVANRQDLRDYEIMLIESRNRIDKLVKEGKTLDEVIAANPTRDLFKGGKSWLPVKLYIATVYMCLSQK
jgi:glyoxylase-like metal-dependent hydrolase (beta-lactamase superfamily II)